MSGGSPDKDAERHERLKQLESEMFGAPAPLGKGVKRKASVLDLTDETEEKTALASASASIPKLPAKEAVPEVPIPSLTCIAEDLEFCTAEDLLGQLGFKEEQAREMQYGTMADSITTADRAMFLLDNMLESWHHKALALFKEASKKRKVIKALEDAINGTGKPPAGLDLTQVKVKFGQGFEKEEKEANDLIEATQRQVLAIVLRVREHEYKLKLAKYREVEKDYLNEVHSNFKDDDEGKKVVLECDREYDKGFMGLVLNRLRKEVERANNALVAIAQRKKDEETRKRLAAKMKPHAKKADGSKDNVKEEKDEAKEPPNKKRRIEPKPKDNDDAKSAPKSEGKKAQPKAKPKKKGGKGNKSKAAGKGKKPKSVEPAKDE